MDERILAVNPLTGQDYPDVDVIRVEDTYYMISTTMHFMPGGVILRSYDLANWEIASYVYDKLEDTPGHNLEGDNNIYGKGMWAASLRYHKGTFYVCFVANDTHKTYLFRSKDINGPWTKSNIEGFYHDCSLLFDDDDRVYIAYGNRTIYLTELNEELTAPKEGGLHRVLVKDADEPCLGFEGTHLYKINGRYYAFFIHSLSTEWFRTESCFSSDSLTGEFVGGDVVADDMGYRHAGVAQGGIVDTPDGKWYGICFQDRGGSGRIPVLIPMEWVDNKPVFGKAGKIEKELYVTSNRPGYTYEPLYGSDDFNYQKDEDGKVHLKKFWQWNHNPHDDLWSVTERPGALRLRSGKVCQELTAAYNTLTQRTTEKYSTASVVVDGSNLQTGDQAGICAFAGCYGAVALRKDEDGYKIVMFGKDPDKAPRNWGEHQAETEYEVVKLVDEQGATGSAVIKLIAKTSYDEQGDRVEFFYEKDGIHKIGIAHKLVFRLDHFCGTRFGLFYNSKLQTGGYADFTDFTYDVK